MKKILLAAASCAAALAVFLIYITLDGGSQRQLNLWYAQDCIPAPVMEELAEEYGSRSGDDSCRIILRSFASEAELAAAFEQERPDLLLCSYTRAASLGSRGLLDAVEAVEWELLPAIGEALPFVGKSFFPLGSRSPILVYNQAALDTAGISPDFGSFEDFLARAAEYSEETGSPFFSAQSLSPVLCACCGSLGYRLEGEPQLDCMDESFTSIYNSLASAALVGSFLPPGEDSLELAAAGLLPCLILDSPGASELPEGLSYAPLPLPEGGRSIYLADILGFAVTGANSFALPWVRDFARWLESYLSPEKVMGMGLIPASAPGESAWDALPNPVLAETWQNSEALIYPPLGNFAENRRDMEEALCRALDLLY